ncbi:hypothetical protein DVR12_26305 [Chitinophaga silvatica]|uniref:DUF4136 domain-containing protein n=1 Tax=Chitinophaga silvatica TaxID=2282649 RepID=A0A3E1Y2K7_9BACT|nr:DUF4136 domain-containing protein [Chitinophaga silvatica]RFS18894.1 hypothetical protein DVR12_26305 [Chitinophaga silvatica]
MKAIINSALVGILLILFGACGTSVQMTGTWKAPEAPTSGFHNILVTAITSNLGAKQSVETQMVNDLRAHGIMAGRSVDIFPPKFNPLDDNDKAQAEQTMKAQGYDAVLTVSLLRKESELRYVPGTIGYAPYPAYGWYGGFWPYYGYMYGSVYSPGYYTTDKTYFLESNLYDLTNNGKLVWSGQSETYNPGSLESFSKAYAAKVSNALQQGGLLR